MKWSVDEWKRVDVSEFHVSNVTTEGPLRSFWIQCADKARFMFDGPMNGLRLDLYPNMSAQIQGVPLPAQGLRLSRRPCSLTSLERPGDGDILFLIDSPVLDKKTGVSTPARDWEAVHLTGPYSLDCVAQAPNSGLGNYSVSLDDYSLISGHLFSNGLIIVQGLTGEVTVGTSRYALQPQDSVQIEGGCNLVNFETKESVSLSLRTCGPPETWMLNGVSITPSRWSMLADGERATILGAYLAVLGWLMLRVHSRLDLE